MLKGLYTAYTGMINEQHRMDVMTNNLANADTNGFKKEGATSQAFDSVLAYKIKDLSEPGNIPRLISTPKGVDEYELNNEANEDYLQNRVTRVGMNLGVKTGENYVDYSEGPMKITNNPLDLAISGNGFFAVEYTNRSGETSVKYTRDGDFTLTQEGRLVTRDGDPVLDENGAPIFPEDLKKTMEDLKRINCRAGEGLVDWKALKETADKNGCRAYIVEREYSVSGNRLNDLKADLEHYRTQIS